MAGSLIGALRVTLGIDTAAFEKGLGIAQKRLNAAGKNLSQIGDKMTGIGAKISVGVTTPLLAMGAASANAFKDFEASMSNVSTLVDTTTESMQDMGRAVLDISKRVPVAASDLTSALYDIRSAGISAGDAMNVLENSAKLGVAGLGTTKEATDLVTSSLNAFNLEGEEAGKVYDLIFRTVKSGKTTISDLSQGFGAVAGTVAQAGIKIDDYLSSVAALTTTGLPAAQAHTQLRAAISGLTRETELSQEVFSKLGVKTFPELIQKSGGLGSAFSKLREATGGNDAELLKLLGSTEAFNAVLSLSGTQNKAYSDTLAGMRDGTEAMGEAFDKQSQTAAAKAQIMRNQLNAAAVQIGQVVVPVLVKIGEFVGKLAERFNELSPETQSAIVAFAAIAAAVGPVLVVAGTLVSSIGALIPIFSGLSAAVGVVGKAFMLLLANPAILAAAAVIGGIYLAWKNWDKIQPIIDKVAAAISNWWNANVSPVLNAVGSAIKAVVTIFSDYFGKQITNVIGILKALFTGDFKGVWDGMRAVVTTAINAAWNVISAFAPDVIKSMQMMVQGIKQWVVNRLTAIWDDLKGKIDAVKGWFFGLYDAVVGNSYVPDMVYEIGQNMARLQKLMVEPAKKATDATKKAFRQLKEDTAALLDRLFPVQAQIRAIMTDMANLDASLKAKLITPEVHAAGKAILDAKLRDARAEASGGLTNGELQSTVDSYLPDEATMRRLAEDADALRVAIAAEDADALRVAIAAGEGDVEAYKRALAEVETEMAKAKEWPLKDELDRLVSGLLPAQAHLADLRAEMVLLNDALATGNIDPETYRQTTLALQEELEVAEEAARRAEMMTTDMGGALIRIGDFGREVGGSIMDALHAGIEGRNVFDALKDSFTNVLKNVSHSALDALEKSIFGEDGLAGALENMFQSLFQSLFGKSGSANSGGGLGGLIGSALGSIFGGAPGFALGGSFTVGGRPGRDANLVAFRATRGEKVSISNGEGAFGAVYQNINFSGAVDLATRAEVYRVADAARVAAIQGVQDANRRAG